MYLLEASADPMPHKICAQALGARNLALGVQCMFCARVVDVKMPSVFQEGINSYPAQEGTIARVIYLVYRALFNTNRVAYSMLINIIAITIDIYVMFLCFGNP